MLEAYQRRFVTVIIITYHLFSFRKSIQDYKNHMDMEIIHTLKVYQIILGNMKFV